MPQPLLKWYDDIKFHPDAIEQRPTLAEWIVKIAVRSSTLDADIGLFLAVVLHTEARTGIAMYLALIGSGAQEAALSAAVAEQLPESLQREFSDILKHLRKRQGERNRVIHCLWAASPHYPDSLIHCPPTNFVQDIVGTSLDARKKRLPLPTTLPPSQEFIESLSVYKEQDFKNIVKRLDEASAKLHAFSVKASIHIDPAHQQFRG